jgi:Lrp/AsnC family leucine-responsive transcriptional regulator
MGIELTDIDKKILSEVSVNARIPAKALARKIDVHPNTLLQRMKRLQTKGVIQGYHGYLDYNQLGFGLHMVIMMKLTHINPGEDATKLKDVLNMKELEAFYALTGEWDAISIWRVRDRQHLSDIIRQITATPAVSKTLTNLILHTYRSPHQFNPLK